MELIDGKKISLQLQEDIAKEVQQLIASGKKQPHLAAVLVGNDGGSETYVAAKIKACERVGFKSTLIRHPEYVTEDKLLLTVHELNTNPDIDGFIVQLPLPRHINEHKVIEAVLPSKDVDGFHPINVGRMVWKTLCGDWKKSYCWLAYEYSYG
ncbi:MAG: 5,10-methylene-tetrahydrofolate cyclohydrolase [Bacteroidetes bacterium]|nr:5,10-methylene-tetrahydrofolate cyclohydrolase [Bacteroidota bacterium]